MPPSPASNNGERFPVAHCRPVLDEQFSFRSDDSFVDNSEDFFSQFGLQSIVAEEPWFQKPLVVVVVGASGDLAKKKTYPSLFELYQHGLLPPQTVIWGYARTAKEHQDFRDHIHPELSAGQIHHSHDNNNRTLKHFLEMCYYHSGNSYGDNDAYAAMLDEITSMATFNAAEANVLYYLAIPPNVFHETVETLEKIPSAVVAGKTKFVIEKPFGRDTASCQELLDNFEGLGEEMQYRLDHYLAKPMVENLVTLRMANPWLENMWSHEFVQAVHIRFKEPFGTQGRGGYFDQYNIIRDVLQNHLLQVLLLVAMELPKEGTEDDDDSDSFRQAKIAVLERMPPILLEDSLLGQYDGYSDDPTIKNKNTNCPTYAQLRCFVNNDRWKGVPFILEAGKALDERVVDVQVVFKNRHPFPSNLLTIQVQPKASMSMTTNMKPLDFISSDSSKAVSTVELTANYTSETKDELLKPIENAYTRLLLDVLRGNQNNFVRADELIRSWEVFTPLLHQIERDNVQPVKYQYGSSGPASRSIFFDEMVQASNIKSSL